MLVVSVCIANQARVVGRTDTVGESNRRRKTHLLPFDMVYHQQKNINQLSFT
jgi:hypothetical protein